MQDHKRGPYPGEDGLELDNGESDTTGVHGIMLHLNILQKCRFEVGQSETNAAGNTLYARKRLH